MINGYAKSVVRNTAIMMTAQVITWLSSFVLMMFLPKYLGSSGYGELYLAVSITTMFQVIIEFGGQYHITKEISRSREAAPNILANSALTRIVLWAVSIVLMLEFCKVANYAWPVPMLVLILGTSKLWEGINSLLRNCYQGFELMEYPSIGSVVERVFLMAAAITVIFAGSGQVMIAAVMAVSTFLNFVVSASFAKKIIHTLPKFDLRKTKSLLLQGVPYFMWSIFATIYYRVDVIMLSLMTSYSVVGWYGAAYKLFDVLMFFPSIFSQALFPVLSRLTETTKGNLTSAFQKSLDAILFVGIPIAILLFLFARQITGCLFGLHEYQNSIILLKIFSIGLLLVYVDFVLGSTVLATDKQKLWSIIAGIAVLINIGLNYYLIPLYQSWAGNGGIGAAIATVLTELFVMCSAIYLLKGHTLDKINIVFINKEILAGSLMAGAIIILKEIAINWMLQAAMSMLVYLITIFLLYAYDKGIEIYSINYASCIKDYFNAVIYRGETKI